MKCKRSGVPISEDQGQLMESATNDDDERAFHIRLNKTERDFLNLMVYKHGFRSKTAAIRGCIHYVRTEYEKKKKIKEDTHCEKEMEEEAI
jgi:hypothetical protein